MTDPSTPRPSPANDPADQSIGQLVSQISESTSRLVRDELRLAQAEMSAKGKKAGIGLGLFGGAGLFAVYAIGCLVAAAVAGLGEATDHVWLGALIVAVVLLAFAGVAALVGKKEVSAATPPMPREAVEGLQQDVRTLKAGSQA